MRTQTKIPKRRTEIGPIRLSPGPTIDLLFQASSNGATKKGKRMNTENSPTDTELTIRDAQGEVDRWIKEVGVRYFSELTNLAQLMEEVGELSRIISRTYGEQSFKSTEGNSSLKDEMADVLFVLICLANQTGVDLTDALRENLVKKTTRDGERHKNNPKLQ